ncbi:MAG: hypothetical protein ACI9SB_002166 [Candidatus Azotimanducaceae bacterium]|jgi:hypothetical protein
MLYFKLDDYLHCKNQTKPRLSIPDRPGSAHNASKVSDHYQTILLDTSPMVVKPYHHKFLL